MPQDDEHRATPANAGNFASASATLDEVSDEQAEIEQAEASTPQRPGQARPGTSVGLGIVGVFGELLITAGVIVALFVVWQVVWTDVEGSLAASGNIEQFEESLPESPDRAGTPQTGPPPVEVAGPEGEAFATMFVPRWGADWEFPIAEGVGRPDVLDAGFVGHYPDTQMPGAIGNFALAGHRQSHAKPFYAVDQLQMGDAIIVQTSQAWYVYRVTKSFIVEPTQVEVLAPNPSDPGAPAVESTITLTTCHPLWSTRQRWIIQGVLDNWVARGDGRPAELLDQEGLG